MTPERRLAAIVGLVLVASALVFATGRTRWAREASPGDLDAALSMRRALAADAAPGYARARRSPPIRFPEDHGPHPRFRNEWWYFTGHLVGADGDAFGYQLTFFRTALEPEPARRPSAWASHQLYMAHLTITDVAAGTFHAAERFGRAALGLAGAESPPFRVWLGDWRARREPSAGVDPPVHPGDGELAPVRLLASEEGLGIDLLLGSARPIVLHGEDGLSRKGDGPGNASRYYSLTRMPTRGEVRIGERVVPVRGTSWFDREWSTGALEPDQEGWDWFALRLDDGRDLMYYRLRRDDGSTDPHSAGSLVADHGTVHRLSAGDVELRVLDHWTSPRGGTVYPARWRLQIPSREIDLDIVPLVSDQEVALSFRYWEGAVRAEGRAGAAPVEGRGHVELTGYAEERDGDDTGTP